MMGILSESRPRKIRTAHNLSSIVYRPTTIHNLLIQQNILCETNISPGCQSRYKNIPTTEQCEMMRAR